MSFSMLSLGITLGFFIAMPVGPIGLLCIQNTIARGPRFGFFCGLGAATADMMYGLLVTIGLSTFQIFLLTIKTYLTISGGIFLMYLGILKILNPPVAKIVQINKYALLGAYVSTFFLTLTNPATILEFIALFTSINIDFRHYVDGILFVCGVFCGSALWWLTLSSLVGIFRTKVSLAVLRSINYAAGTMIMVYGLWAITKGIF